MIDNFEFVIGVSSKFHALKSVNYRGVTIVEHDYEQPFSHANNIDIEMVAVSLYETKYPYVGSIPRPRNIAMTRVPPSSDYFAPTVITTPVYDPEVLTQFISSLAHYRSNEKRQSVSTRILEDLISWSLLFDELYDDILKMNYKNKLRVGFHCQTIGFFKTDETELKYSFTESYANFLRKINK